MGVTVLRLYCPMSVSVVAGALPGALVFYSLMPISSDVRFSGHAVVLPGVDVLGKQILSFKSSPHFANDTKEGFVNRFFWVCVETILFWLRHC